MPRTLFVFLLLVAQFAVAQPHLQGRLFINRSLGLIDADFRLSNVPPLANYRILLNHGLNIHSFSNDSAKPLRYDGFYSGRMRGEALEYVLMKTDTDTLRPLPSSFRIRYRGAFPVYGDTLNLFDFKGYIAVNRNTLRAAEQSKWYPVLYDAATDRLVDNYTYDITVTAPDCKTVYLNGSAPQQKSPARFVSTVPRALFLFAGNYDFVSDKGNYLLNAGVDRRTAAQIFRGLETIKAFHTKNLGLAFTENIYLVSHQSVKPYPPQASWGFTVFPSFAYANLDFKKLVDSAGRFSNDDLAFFAHELSHSYFGGRMASGPWQWFFVESTTEYLSLKAAEALAGPGYYKGVVARYANYLKDKSYPPLGRITQPETIDEDYRYVYGPLILLAFEKRFGKQAVYQVLRQLVAKAETQTLTLTTFRQAALAAGVGEKEYSVFEEECLQSEAALANVRKVAAD